MWERLPAANSTVAAGSRSHIQYHLFFLDNQIKDYGSPC